MFGSSRQRGGTIAAPGMLTPRVRTDAKTVAPGNDFGCSVWLRHVKQ